MITKKQALANIKVRSSNALPESDRDVGTVVDVNLNSPLCLEVLVAWESGVRTWHIRSQLFALTEGPRP